jgi:hypothetical protein
MVIETYIRHIIFVYYMVLHPVARNIAKKKVLLFIV